jgi:hypothetical protein
LNRESRYKKQRTKVNLKQYLIRIVNPIGLICCVFTGFVLTMAEPVGLYLLNPIACPEEGCNVEIDVSSRLIPVGVTQDLDVVCLCADGTATPIPFWMYLVHFFFVTLVLLIPVVAWGIISNSLKVRKKKKRR